MHWISLAPGNGPGQLALVFERIFQLPDLELAK